MKRCIGCNEEKLLDRFCNNGGRRIKPRCKECDAKADMERYKRKISRIIGEEHLKCQVCGYNNCFAALEFHHIDSESKDRNVSKLRNYSEERLKLEISKCVLLCAIHHREVHAGLVDLSGYGVVATQDLAKV